MYLDGKIMERSKKEKKKKIKVVVLNATCRNKYKCCKTKKLLKFYLLFFVKRAFLKVKLLNFGIITLTKNLKNYLMPHNIKN